MRILVVEDNLRLAMNIVEFLEADGHTVDHASDGVTAVRAVTEGAQSVVILDVALPRMDGLEVCRRIRHERGRSVGVVMLTARDTLDDKLAGFDAGADDYLVKPFELAELEARVRAVSSRPGSVTDEAGAVLSFHSIRLDLASWRAEAHHKPIALTRIGMRILEGLLRHAPEAIPTDDLRRHVWGEYAPSDNVLRTHMAAVRKAIDVSGEESLIENIRGVGYRLRNPNA